MKVRAAPFQVLIAIDVEGAPMPVVVHDMGTPFVRAGRRQPRGSVATPG
jgi:hypothetical protein